MAAKVKSSILNTVWRYYKGNLKKRNANDPKRGKNWAQVLLAFGVNPSELDPADQNLTPMEAKQARANVKNWWGWRPVAEELERLEKANSGTAPAPAPTNAYVDTLNNTIPFAGKFPYTGWELVYNDKVDGTPAIGKHWTHLERDVIARVRVEQLARAPKEGGIGIRESKYKTISLAIGQMVKNTKEVPQEWIDKHTKPPKLNREQLPAPAIKNFTVVPKSGALYYSFDVAGQVSLQEEIKSSSGSIDEATWIERRNGKTKRQIPKNRVFDDSVTIRFRSVDPGKKYEASDWVYETYTGIKALRDKLQAAPKPETKPKTVDDWKAEIQRKRTKKNAEQRKLIQEWIATLPQDEIDVLLTETTVGNETVVYIGKDVVLNDYMKLHLGDEFDVLLEDAQDLHAFLIAEWVDDGRPPAKEWNAKRDAERAEADKRRQEAEAAYRRRERWKLNLRLQGYRMWHNGGGWVHKDALVHPSVYVTPGAKVRRGTIEQDVRIGQNAFIDGEGVVIGAGCGIGPEVGMYDNAQLLNGAFASYSILKGNAIVDNAYVFKTEASGETRIIGEVTNDKGKYMESQIGKALVIGNLTLQPDAPITTYVQDSATIVGAGRYMGIAKDHAHISGQQFFVQANVIETGHIFGDEICVQSAVSVKGVVHSPGFSFKFNEIYVTDEMPVTAMVDEKGVANWLLEGKWELCDFNVYLGVNKRWTGKYWKAVRID